jgi:CRISPR system Cascade subunit CasD
MSRRLAYLVLLLDGPLQAWGFSSQFERRTTSLFPSKSAITGLICAAMGVAKGSAAEADVIQTMAAAEMLSVTVPKSRGIQRLQDFHTVCDTRRANNELNKLAVVSHREYLLDARFLIVFQLPEEFARSAAAALDNPVWGIWLGRKSCIPAEPVCRGIFTSEAEALHKVLGGTPLTAFTTVRDAHNFETATDALRDRPVSFGGISSSGSHLREYAIRRVCVSAAETPTNHERPTPATEDS